MYTQLLTATDLDSSGLHALLGDADPIGVLSIFVDGTGDRRATAIDIQNRLAQLERAVSGDEPPERAVALSEAFARLAPKLEHLHALSARGRGRALFTPLTGGTPILFSTQLRLPNRVVLDDRPFVHPLLESLDRGRAAGVILVARDLVEVLEWRQGELASLARIEPRVDHRAGGPGALGVTEVLGALNDARVMHLIYDPEIRYAGFIAENGRLLDAREPRRLNERVFAEPRMTERMVERCLETGARITPVSGAASTVLADAGGIAARLRW